MKLQTGRIDAFLRRPDPKIRAVLIYGPDAGLVRERAEILARTVVDDLNDPFRVVVLPAAAITGDPARLVDEAAAISMLGGRRLIRVREAEERLVPAFANLLQAAPPGDSLVVVEAGDLDSRSKLRALFESADTAAALPCYVAEEGALGHVIAEMLGRHGLSIDPDAQEYLAANLVGDRMVARRELEKLALYMGAGGAGEAGGGARKRVELEDARTCVGDSAALSFDDPAWAAGDGDFAGLDRALVRLYGEGIDPIPILRAAQRHFQRLHLVCAQVVRGSSAEIAVAGLKPPVFFKQRNQFAAQVRKWSPAKLREAMERLTEAEAACKRTGMPTETLCARTLLQVAAMARSR